MGLVEVAAWDLSLYRRDGEQPLGPGNYRGLSALGGIVISPSQMTPENRSEDGRYSAQEREMRMVERPSGA